MKVSFRYIYRVHGLLGPEAKAAAGAAGPEEAKRVDGAARGGEAARIVTRGGVMKALGLGLILSALSVPICGVANAQAPDQTPAAAPSGHVPVITNPDWLKKPTIDDLMAVYPAQALKKGVSGTATIKCIVQITGLTRACTVVKEDHPGMGFGPAAIVLSRTLLFKPRLRDGQPEEAEVTVPINFKTYGRVFDDNEPYDGDGASRIRKTVPPPTPTSTTVLGEAVWSKTPTVAEILGEIDKKVGDKFAEGLVVFQCRLDKKSGKLGKCVVANASPGMVQFSDVAKSLVPKFQADPTILDEAKGDVLVNLAFAFPDMSSPAWDKRYLTHPRWNKALGPDSNVSTFPEAATKAGLKTGSATVDCVVAGNGALTRCETVRESNPNVGFGETAIQIAQTFVANPWNEDGLPVDGAHVRMPIQMDYAPPAETPPPAPTPATKP